jgi:hypothetical protein
MLNRLAAGFVALALGASAAQADTAGVKAGVLTCHVASGWGFVFGSSRDLRCTYRPVNGGVEHYVGDVGKFGVDIGYSEDGVIVWTVLAPASSVAKGALQGTYAGATAEAAFGPGAGANVLLGGAGRSIALEPVSIQGEAGLNVAAGIGAINLRSRD